MAIINYSAARINELLAAAETAAQPSDVHVAVQDAENNINDTIGQLSGLNTTEKGSVVGAINENFTSASDGKTAIAAALTGKGQTADASETFASLAGKIGNLKPAGYVDPSGYVKRLVSNENAITPSGSYATSTYYNLDYGVKIGYMANGDILLSMRSGTTTAYEVLRFTLASAPSGVTLTAHDIPSTTAGPAAAIYACVLSGITVPVNIAVSMDDVNSNYDYTTCSITVTEVTA